MASLLDRIKAHADPKRMRRIEVPEWAVEQGGPPLVITYSMVTLDDLSLVNEADGGGDFNKQAARVIALKALDEKGERLFSLGDATVIRETAAPEVVKRIAMAMLSRVSIDDAEKN
jgi:hypothetical protein